MCLFLGDFPNSLCIPAVLQLLTTSIRPDFTPTVSARLSHRNISLRSLCREVLEEPSLFPFLTTSCSFPTLPHRYLPAAPVLPRKLYRDIRPEMLKARGCLPHFLQLKHQLSDETQPPAPLVRPAHTSRLALLMQL